MADTPKQTVPGADVLLDTLRRSPLRDEQRQQLWDAYQTPGDEKAFIKGLNSLDIDDSVKQTMYDMRFKGFKALPTQTTQSDSQSPHPSSLVPSQISATSPSMWDRAKSMFSAGIPALNPDFEVASHTPTGQLASGETPKMQLITPEAAMTSSERQRHPIATGLAEVTGGLTSPENTAILAGTAGLGTLPGAAGRLIPRLVSAGFTGQMIKGVYDAYPEFKAAMDRGDASEAERLFTHMVATGAFAALSGQHALKGEALPADARSKTPTTTPQTSTPAPAPQQRAIEYSGPMPEATTPNLEQRTGQLALDFNARPQEHVPTKLQDVQIDHSTDTTQIVTPKIEVPKLTDEQNATVNDAINRIKAKQEAPKPIQPTQQAILDAGFVDKGELVPGSGVFQMEHPDHYGQTVAINATKETVTPELLRNKLADKLQDNLDNLNAGKKLMPIDNDIYRESFDKTKLADSITKLRGKEAEAVQPITQAPVAEVPSKPAVETSPTQSGPINIPELPNWIKNEIGRLPEVQRLAAATNELSPERKTAVGNLAKVKRNVSDGILNFVAKMGSREAGLFRDDMREKAGRFDAQAKEVQRIVDNHPIAEAIREEMAAGSPAKSPAGGVTIIGSTHADMRTVLHDALGDKTQSKFDEIAINQRAKLREKGIDPDAGVEADRRAILENSKKELAELQAYGKKRLIELTESHLEKNASRVQEVGEDEAAAEAKKVATAQVMQEKLADGKTMRERVSALREIIGREAQRDVYSGKGKAVIEDGVVKHPGQIAEKTLDLAQKIWGRKLNKIPDSEQWTAKIAELQSTSQLHSWIADRADRRIQDIKTGFKGQEGFAAIGGVPLTKETVAVPKQDKILNLARQFTRVRDIMEEGSVNRGFITPDGKYAIELPERKTHDETAWRLLGKQGESLSGNSYDALFKAGYVAKDFDTYRADNFANSSRVAAAEMDAIRDKYSRHLFLQDNKGTHEITSGWDDFPSAAASALRYSKRYEIGDESGFASIRQMATTGAITGGTAIGYLVGGPEGAIIGGGVGAAVALGLPKTLRVPALFRQSLSRVAPMLSNAGITLRDWYVGAQQRTVDSDMQAIIEKQNTSLRGGPTENLLSRMGKIPGNILQHFDPLLFVNDRLGPVVSRLLGADPRGQAFRDLNGKLTVDDSPYVAVVNAIGGGSGAGEIHLLSYKGLFGEAEKAGSLNELYKYLNLKGYQRVWDVLSDRMWKFDSDINNFQQQLFAGGFKNARERIGIEDQLAEANRGKRALQDQMSQGKVTPDNYDPSKIHNSLIDLQQNMSPADYTKVEAWGKRVFQLNRKVLDLVHNAGIVGDDEYQTYVNRGDEYIPMHRILENISDMEYTNHGSSPLYLKQQNVINALRGSQKVNVNPIVASADANLQALKEVARNNVVKNFLDLAQQDPKGVGQLFKEVPVGYKPKTGEGTVGHYNQGQVKYYKTPDWLAATLQHASPIAAETGVGAMQRWFKATLQGTATAGNLAWSLPNAIRHFGDMAIMSKAGLKLDATLPKDAAMLIKTWGESLKATIQQNGDWKEYVQSGAAYSTLQRQLTPEAELDPNQIGHAPNWRTRPLDAVRKFNQAIEDTTKLTTFTRLRQMGYTEKAAAFETRRYGGGPDFARMGAGSAAINQYAMFFNAHIQYLSRVFSRVGEDPKRMGTFLGALSIVALSLNQYNWQFKLPNGQPSMQAVPHTDRENNFVIMTGNSYVAENGSRVPQYYRVPKPSVLKFLYNPIEQIVNGVSKEETRSGTQRTLDTLSAYAPGQLHVDEDDKLKSVASSALANLNPLISEPLQQAMNYEAYSERPIVPSRLQGVETSHQFVPTTPNVYKEMGQGGVTGAEAGATLGGSIGLVVGGTKGALVGGGVGAAAGAIGISPLRAQQFVQGTTAGVGQGIASIGDLITGGRNFPFQGQQATRQIPGVGTVASRFVGTPVNQSERDKENKFYQQLASVDTIQKTYQQMSKSQPDLAAAYLQTNIGAYRAAVVGQEMKTKIGEINSAIARTQQSTTLSDKDKLNSLESLHTIKTNLIDSFNGVIRSLTTGGRKNPEPAGPPQGGAGWSR